MGLSSDKLFHGTNMEPLKIFDQHEWLKFDAADRVLSLDV